MNQSNKIYRAAIYLRLSKEDGDVAAGGKNESNSISNQKSLILDFLKGHQEIQVVSVREDDGFSGVDFNRPSFQQMMEDVKAGHIDCILVKDLSRFGRNYIEVGRYLEKIFPMLGIRFIAVNDGYDSLDADTAHDIVMPFKNLINDSYCRDLSVKIRSHLAVKRKNGEFIGAFACYGYLKDPQDKNHLIVDTYAGSVVQDIFKMKLNGYSQYRIAEILNERGVLSPMEYKHSLGIPFETSFKVSSKAMWKHKTVQRILTNEVYIGVLTQGKETTPNHKVKVRQKVDKADWVRVENAHAPLISPHLFEIVQNVMERDTRTSPGEAVVYPLAGLLYCGDCGQPMVRKSVAYQKKSGQGEDSIQKSVCYVCHGHSTAKSCSWHRVQESELLESVLQAVNLHIKSVLDVEQALRAMDTAPSVQFLIERQETYLAKKQEELKKAEKLKIGIYEDLKDGLLDQAEYQKLKAEFDGRIKAAQRNIQEMTEEIQKLKTDRTGHYEWMEYFREFGELKELTRFAAVMMIHRILVYENRKIEIIFNFSQSFEQAQELVQTMNRTEEAG